MMWNQTLHETVTGPPLTLTADLLIGAGGHKKVYVHPQDESLCVKVLHYGAEDKDWQKELRYRRSREKRSLTSTLLTEYYGACPLTGGGIGYVFERIRDFDGHDSLTFQDHIDRLRSLPQIDRNAVIAGMVTFRYFCFGKRSSPATWNPAISACSSYRQIPTACASSIISAVPSLFPCSFTSTRWPCTM